MVSEPQESEQVDSASAPRSKEIANYREHPGLARGRRLADLSRVEPRIQCAYLCFAGEPILTIRNEQNLISFI